VPSRNPESLKREIQRLLKNADFRKSLGENARKAESTIAEKSRGVLLRAFSLVSK
jgi:hypothetical protein